MKRFLLLIYCCTFLCLCSLMAQTTPRKLTFDRLVMPFQISSDSLIAPINNRDSIRSNPFKIKLVDYSVKMGIMCIGEQKFEKATKVPLRLRLGSLAYTNWLEGKPNSFK